MKKLLLLFAVLIFTTAFASGQTAQTLACLQNGSIVECGPNATTMVGVFQPGNQSGIISTTGLSIVNLATSSTTTLGDYACSNVVAGTIVDNGLNPCPTNQQVGFINTSNTIPVTSVLVFLHFTSEGGGGGGSVFQVNGVNLISQGTVNFENGTLITASNPSNGNVQFNFTGILPSTQTPVVGNFITGYNSITGAFSTGSISSGLGNQAANLVFAGPSSGSPALPAFRALTLSDLPAIGFSNLTGVASVAQGGTGQITTSAAFNALAPPTSVGGLVVGTGTSTYGNLPIGTSGQCLTSNGTTAAWGACSSGSGVTLETNGTNNSSQTSLNLINSPVTNGQTLTMTNTTGGTVQLGISGTLNDAGLTSSYSGIGVCGSHTWVSTLVRNTGPTCTQPGFGDLTGTITLSQTQLTTLGDLLYAGTGPALARLAGNTTTTKMFLTQTGTGVVSAAPLWSTIVASDVPNPAGDINGTYAATTVTGLHFGANGYPLSASALVSGQCLADVGGTIQGTTCGSGGSGLPGSWTLNATTNTVAAQPASGQDAPTIVLAPSISAPTADIFDVCSTIVSGLCGGTKYFAIGPNGNLSLAQNAITFGSTTQTNASYVGIIGGTGANPYLWMQSGQLPTPGQPVPTAGGTGGTIPTGSSYQFEIVYLSGPAHQYTTAHSTASAPLSVTLGQQITLPSPPQIAGATAWDAFEEDSSHGVWVEQGPYTSFTNQTLSSINYTTVVTPPTTNNTGGQYNTYFTAAAGMNGEGCISGTVPGYDCAAGTWIARDPLLSLGDIPYGNTPNAEGFAPLARLAAPTTNGTYCMQEVVTASAPVAPTWGSCGSGSSAWSALTAPSAPLTIAMGANSTTFNWTSGLQTAWDTSGNLDLSTTQAATSGSNHASPNFILSPTYWNGTASASGLWTFGASVNSSNAAVLTLTPSNFGSDATAFAVSGHFVGNNTPMFTLNGDATGAVMDFEVAFSQLATIRASTPQKNLLLNAGGTGALYLNYDSGSGGVNFANGASGVVGSVSSAGAASFASLSLTTALPVASGGSGAGSFTAHGVLLGEGTSAFGVTSAGTTGQCLTSNGASADPTYQTCGAGTGVSSVSNSDGTLTISPTTGAVVASLALGHANTWTATQTFGTNISIGNISLGTPTALTLTNATGLPTAGLVNNAVTSAKMAVVNTRRVCDMVFGDESASALTNAQLGPQKRMCYIPAAATVVEVDVSADAGTPNIIVAVNHAGTDSNIVSAALATAASGGIACSNTGGTTGIDGATTCSATLQNTSMAAGDYLEAVSGTAGGTAKLMTVHVIYTIN